MKLAIASTATLLGYYYFFTGQSLYLFQMKDEYDVKPYYKIYIEGGIAKALNVKEDKIACRFDNDCLKSLKKRAYSLIKFRFYDLEERTEDLYKETIII